MQEAFVNINGIPTNVLTYGRWIEESPKPSDPEDIVLVIPGNPGVTGFYKLFMQIVHEKTGSPVWIVGHAGHEIPRSNTTCPPLKGNENLFGLKGQIEHKTDFIEKYVPKNAKLHLVGHSVGAYIILNLLKNQLISSKVADVKLLFPTVEHLRETPNGEKFGTQIISKVRLVVFLFWVYSCLPSILQKVLMYIYMKLTGKPGMHFDALVHFIDGTIIEKVLFLAFEELDQIKERDDKIIKANIYKIRFLYGYEDKWAPPNYCDNLKNDIPGVDAEIYNFSHDFVISQSQEIGSLVGDWLATN